VLTDPADPGAVFAPVGLWLAALDRALASLRAAGLDFAAVRAVAGAGMQHGTVFWARGADEALRALDPEAGLEEQLGPRAFSHPFSPNWQDASTQRECIEFNAALSGSGGGGSGPARLAAATGSSAHHRFSGPQLLKFRRRHPERYAATARVSLVSSFLASVLAGTIAPIDVADVGGTNLWDIRAGCWHDALLALTAGEDAPGPATDDLRAKLGAVATDASVPVGRVAPYFVARYGFSPGCAVFPFTGDNPATMLALPLGPNEAIVSLGTSTTLLMSTARYHPDPAYHFMPHPTTPGLYMFMLCYKNGALARERVRDALNAAAAAAAGPEPSEPVAAGSWTLFDAVAARAPPLGQPAARADGGGDAHPAAAPMRVGLFFPRPEIVPAVRAGVWRALYTPPPAESAATAGPLRLLADPPAPADDWPLPAGDVRAILEAQFLSLRLRSRALVTAPPPPPAPASASAARELLPPQPTRVFVVGGGSRSRAATRVCGQVLGGARGVFALAPGRGGGAAGAAALGGAHKAAWGAMRAPGQAFDEFLRERWGREAEGGDEGYLTKVAEGYCEGVWERYGLAVDGLDMLEKEVLRVAGMQGEE
jgi:xylulokinase